MDKGKGKRKRKASDDIDPEDNKPASDTKRIHRSSPSMADLPPIESLIGALFRTPGLMSSVPLSEQLHHIIFEVSNNPQWAARLQPEFANADYCEQVIEKDEILAQVINQCTKTGDWEPLFALLLEKYLPVTPHTLHQSSFTIEDVLQQTRDLLHSPSIRSELEIRAQRSHQDIDASNNTTDRFSFFMDGIGMMYDDKPEVRDRVDCLFTTKEPYEPRLLFNTSGSGKTRLLIEGLCQHWGFYFVAKDGSLTHPGPLGSDDVTVSWDHLSDSADFLQEIVHSSPRTRQMQHTRNVYIAERIFQSLLLSRGLVLEAFLDHAVNDDHQHLRRGWMHLQLVPFKTNGSDIFTAVLRTILKCPNKKSISQEMCEVLLRLTKKLACRFLWIVLDEAQIASMKFPGSFYTEQEGKKTEAGHGRSVLREMVMTFAPAGIEARIIIAGTGLSLDSVSRNSESAVSKYRSDFVVWSHTGGFDTKESQSLYLHQKLDSAGRNKLQQKILDRAWHWLRGRYRFTATFAALLLQFGIKRANPLLNGLVKHLTDGYEPTDVASTPLTVDENSAIEGLGRINLSKLSNNSQLQEELARASLQFLTKGGAYITSSQNAGVVQLGFARLEQEKNSIWRLGIVSADQTRLKVILNEPLAVAAALRYFEGHKSLSIDRLIENNLRSNSQPALRGFLMETVTMMALLRAFNGTKSLSEIFQVQDTRNKGYMQQPASLQAIVERGKNDTFQTIPAQFQEGSVPVLGFATSQPEDVIKWLKGSNVIFLFPPNNMGPDIIFLVKANKKYVWIFVQVRSRTKRFTPQETSKALKTVNPELFWIDKNGDKFSSKKRPNLTQEILTSMRIPDIPVLMVLVSHPSIFDRSVLDDLAIGIKEPKFLGTFDVSKDSEFSTVLAEIKEFTIE